MAFMGNENVMAKEVTESSVVMSETVTTSRNLPATRSCRLMGVTRIVSMVPRSFSPAVTSMAGVTAPTKHRKMIM